MKINPLGKALLVFLASYLLLLVLFSQFGFIYFKLFQGIFRWEINAFFHPFKVSSLTTETHGGQAMITLVAKLTEDLKRSDGLRLHTIGRPLTARTIAINQYLHPIIIFSILLAWPALVWRDRIMLWLLVLPFLIILEMVDIPIVLATRCVEAMQASLLNDPSAGKSLGSYWVAFLHTGGRAALSVMAAGLALGCFYLIRSRRGLHTVAGQDPKSELQPAKTGRNAPCPCGSGKKYKNCCGAK